MISIFARAGIVVVCLIALLGVREVVIDTQTSRLRFFVALLEACLATTMLVGTVTLLDSDIVALVDFVLGAQ